MYRYKDGQIYDVKTGQTVAITYAATPQQGACFAAAPQMLAALEALIEAATHHQADLRQALTQARDAVDDARDVS